MRPIMCNYMYVQVTVANDKLPKVDPHDSSHFSKIFSES